MEGWRDSRDRDIQDKKIWLRWRYSSRDRDRRDRDTQDIDS